MLEFSVRAAKPEEAQSIQRLIRASRLNPTGLDWRRFVVAEDQNGEFIGCGQVKPHRDGSQELASLAVVEAWRGRGVGTAITEHLMRRAGPPLWLMCRSGLTPMYRRLGFCEVGPEESQPPYFKRVRRLAKAFDMFSRSTEYLAVMVWEKALGGRASGRPDERSGVTPSSLGRHPSWLGSDIEARDEVP